MQFTYTYLKNAADNNVMLGHWEGKNVYAISKDDLCESAPDAYVIYDDNNLLYYDGKVYGQVSASGSIDLFRARSYAVRRAATPQVESFRSEEAPEEPQVPEETTPTTSVVGDVQLEIMVDDTLKAAREMSIDSLLDGFNYGL